MLVYDTILTLGTEIGSIWSRRITVAGCLHIVNRYAQIGSFASALILNFPVRSYVS